MCGSVCIVQPESLAPCGAALLFWLVPGLLDMAERLSADGESGQTGPLDEDYKKFLFYKRLHRWSYSERRGQVREVRGALSRSGMLLLELVQGPEWGGIILGLEKYINESIVNVGENYVSIRIQISGLSRS